METFLLVLIILVAMATGYCISWFIKIVPSRVQERIYWSQQLLLTYLIMDEMFRQRFVHWAKSEQAQQYAEFISEHFPGVVYVPPVGDPDKMKTHLDSMGVTENADV